MFSMLVSKTPYLLVFRFLLLIHAGAAGPAAQAAGGIMGAVENEEEVTKSPAEAGPWQVAEAAAAAAARRTGSSYISAATATTDALGC